MDLPDHIPVARREELARIVRQILKIVKKPEKILLFGSYARGNFVEYHMKRERDGTKTLYQSDFDIAVITRTRGEAKAGNVYAKTEEKIREDAKIATPVDWVWEGWEDMNARLEEGVSFYRDIVKEGVMLYDKNRKTFSSPKKLTNAQRKKKNRVKLENYLGIARSLYRAYEGYRQDIKLLKKEKSVTKKRDAAIALQLRYDQNNSLFLLHQVSEKTYAGLWEGTTGYKPKIHDLHKMADKVERMYPEVALFGKRTLRRKDGTTRFEILARGYVDARYDFTFSVEPRTLSYLGRKVRELLETGEQILGEKF